MPYSLRWSIAIGVLAIAWVIWLFIFNGSDVPTTTTASVGVCIMVVAFMSLGVLATEQSPFLPVWVSIGAVVVQSALIIVSLIGRPAGSTPMILSGVMALAIAGGVLVRPRRRMALGLFVALGLLGIYGLAVVPWSVLKYGGAPVRNTGAPVGILGAACLAAAWHALRARPGRYRPIPSTTR